MGSDPILAWAAQARIDPAAVARDLKALSSTDREGLLVQTTQNYNHAPYRHYDPDVTRAVRSLVANEYVATPSEQNWQTFFTALNPHGAHFSKKYHQLWKTAHGEGVAKFFARPEMLADVLQTVQQIKGVPIPIPSETSLIVSAPAKTVRASTPLAVGDHSVTFFVCGDYDVTSAGRSLLVSQLQWVHDMGYEIPKAVAITNIPGGYHYYNNKMCGQQDNDLFYVAGNAVRIGMPDPEREPCTARHELSHVIYAQLDKTMRKRVMALYTRAVQPDSDFGLIFNDEYYMHTYLHAGHPMLNDSEFFAGAMHAYTQHRAELMANINATTTPKAVRSYAMATIQLLNQIISVRPK